MGGSFLTYSKETNKEKLFTTVRDNKTNLSKDESTHVEHQNENFHTDIIDEIPTIHVILCV